MYTVTVGTIVRMKNDELYSYSTEFCVYYDGKIRAKQYVTIHDSHALLMRTHIFAYVPITYRVY